MPKKQATAEEPDTQTVGIETTSAQYLDQWNRLISTTNWDKGRIIADWRQALENSGASPREFSDEAWSRHVGNTSPQHVGRLRRVYERFGDVREDFPGLYWSHFQVALDWSDAEMWLEGAVQNAWSISQMCRKRWETLGSLPEDEPSGGVVTAEYDEDVDPGVDELAAGPLSGKIETVHDPDEEQASVSRRTESEGSHAADTEPDDDREPADEMEPARDVNRAATAVRPFEDLPELPDDLAEAFEAFKLAILRHKMDRWTEVSRQDVVRSLQALEQLAVATDED